MKGDTSAILERYLEKKMNPDLYWSYRAEANVTPETKEKEAECQRIRFVINQLDDHGKSKTARNIAWAERS